MDDLTSANLGARRNEDIALDLLKFVAATAGVGRAAAPSTGFSGATAPKPEEHVSQLLSLYSRCLKTVQGQEPASEAQETPGQTAVLPVKALELPLRAPQGWTPQP